jgi:hypothetical protein
MPCSKGVQGMKLISCDGCGSVFDSDKITFPDLTEYEYQSGNSIWDGDRYVPIIPCPVCDYEIQEED